MSLWATPADITDRWIGAGVPTDESLLGVLINDAEQVILAEFPAIQTRIDDDTLSEDLVVMVVSRMVTRVLRNPDNATYIQQSTGPFGQARNLGDQIDIFLTADERQLLQPLGRNKAFSFSSAPDMRDPDPVSEEWVDQN